MPVWNDPTVRERIDRLELPFNRHGVDPFGVSRADLTWAASLLGWLYRHYFSVRVHGIDHVPARGRAMLVGNHSGGIALDAAMVLTSLLLDHEPPRLAHAMADRFLNRMAFASSLSCRTGQLTGLPEHAVRLLEDERLLLVFPEGAHGTEKLFWQRNSLVKFGTGFMRLALQARAPIVPFAFIGGGDAIPTVLNLYALGRLIGVPYLPVTPYVVPIPRPVSLAIHYGEPMQFDGTGDEDDDAIAAYVDRVKQRIAALIARGTGSDPDGEARP
jgi:1-acyl-sn-glycerol-3-phosphate acyltransferase